jgi:hypothetical protein
MKNTQTNWTLDQSLSLLVLARMKTATALEERLECGRFDDLMRWLGSHQSAQWMHRGQAQAISRKLLEVVHESLNEGEPPFTDKGFVRGGSDLVAALEVGDRTIRNTSRLLEQLLDLHGLSAERLNAKAMQVRALRRRYWRADETTETQVGETDTSDETIVFEEVIDG